MRDGIRPDVPEEKKLRHFYLKLLRTEDTLREKAQEIERLKKQQKDEMQVKNQ